MRGKARRFRGGCSAEQSCVALCTHVTCGGNGLAARARGRDTRRGSRYGKGGTRFVRPMLFRCEPVLGGFTESGVDTLLTVEGEKRAQRNLVVVHRLSRARAFC